MLILIPGRHHLLTKFQERLLLGLCAQDPDVYVDLDGRPLGSSEDKIEAIIFALTSSNHQNTRRNPLPFHLRAMAIQDFANALPLPVYVFGIPDLGVLPDFASYVLKSIRHQSDGRFSLSPQNSVVVCSTPVLEGYEKLGFRVQGAELKTRDYKEYRASLPWEIVERIAAAGRDWKDDAWVLERIHPASSEIFRNYGLGERVAMLFADGLIGQDGDLTETRDYNSYVRQMDEIAQLKFEETRPFIKPGRIGDIGCAVGSWIKLACAEPGLRESDFYGVEAARQLYALCQQRKENGEFPNPYVFFSQKNAVSGLCFPPASMDCIHSSSLTHEIESYSGHADLLRFIDKRLAELSPGGLWINRDVLGPEDGSREVLLWLSPLDGMNQGADFEARTREEFKEKLEALSSRERFKRFCRDFRRSSDGPLEGAVECRSLIVNGEEYYRVSLAEACEYLYKKDYTDNWQSEMHERFCFWGFEDWKTALRSAGFNIGEASRAFRNEWIVKNRFEGRAALFTEDKGCLKPLDFPVSHMIMIAERGS